MLPGQRRCRVLALALLSLCAGLLTPSARAQLSDEHLKACAACHGNGGRSQAEAYYPSIAGKPADYLYAQLRGFREARRHNEVMAGMLAFLSDDYLREIAAYYAAQMPSMQPRQKAASTAQLRLGRALAEHGDAARGLPACRACHGRALGGTLPGIPGLLGLPADYLSAQLGAWQTGRRRALAPDCMAWIAKSLSAEEVGAVSAWLASQPYPDAPGPEPEVTDPSLPRCGTLP